MSRHKSSPVRFGRWSLVPPVAVGIVVAMATLSLLWVLARGIVLIEDILWPLAMALLLAYIFDPMVTWMCGRLRMGRLLATTILFVIGYSGLVVLLVWLIPVVINQVIGFFENLPEMLARLRAWASESRWLYWLRPAEVAPPGQPVAPPGPPSLAQQFSDYVRDNTRLVPLLQRGVEMAGAGLNVVLFAISLLILMPLYAFVFTWRFDRIKQHVDGWVPESRRSSVREMAHKMDRLLSAFLRGRLIACVIVGLMTGGAFALIGLPYAALLGVLVGLTNIVPYMALFVALPVAAAVAVFVPEQGQVWMLILTLITFTITQSLDAFVITPAIQRKATSLHPVTIVVVLLIGPAWMGMLGLLVAVPVAAMVKVLFVDWIGPRLRQWLHTGPPGGPPGHENHSDEQEKT